MPFVARPLSNDAETLIRRATHPSYAESTRDRAAAGLRGYIARLEEEVREAARREAETEQRIADIRAEDYLNHVELMQSTD